MADKEETEHRGHEHDEHDEHEHGHEETASNDADGTEAAHRVASALGVEGEEAKPSEDAAEEEEAPQLNRAARRAEASQRRKKRKGSVAEEAVAADAEIDEVLPKDKNARAKELLKRRRDQAQEPRQIQLLPGEMVDDALARSGSAIGKWIRDNFTILQWVFIGAVVASGGFLFYQTRVQRHEARATAALMEGVTADDGRVLAEDKRTDEQKQGDPMRVFKTSDERADTALAAYKKVEGDHAGTAPALLARLGEAGDYLDKQDWTHALEAYDAVSSSTLAGADPDVKGRALEGLGFAKEGKGDLDGALSTFKELESIDLHGYKELGLYHQGRIWLARGDKDKAKDFLKQAHDKIEQAGADAVGTRYVQQMVDEALKRIDPSLVASKAPPAGAGKGGSYTPEQIQKLEKQITDQLKQKDKH